MHQNATIAPAAAARPALGLPKKAAVKPPPPPEHVIEISSDSDQSMQSESSASSVRKVSRKKVINTLTSVLSARSKVRDLFNQTSRAECHNYIHNFIHNLKHVSYFYESECQAAGGIIDKALPLIEDIDRLDGDNELAVVDYIEDIYKFYKIAEVSTENSALQMSDLLAAVSESVLSGLFQHENRPLDYIEAQVEINSKMRAILADWIIEVHHKFELMPETLYLTMYIIDQYLSLQPVLRRELQLVGVSAMLIACKYEEIWAPEVYLSALCLSVLLM